MAEFYHRSPAWRDLAARAELSYPYISQIETGDRDPSLKTLRRLADALVLPVEELASMVSQDSWALSDLLTPSSAAMIAGRSAPMRTSRGRSPEPSTDSYRARVLPPVEKRLAPVPPLIRIELLNELIAKAIEELRRSGE